MLFAEMGGYIGLLGRNFLVLISEVFENKHKVWQRGELFEYRYNTLRTEFCFTDETISQKLGISLFDILILFNDVLIDKFYRDTKTTSGSEPGKSSPQKVFRVKQPPSSFY